MDKVQSLNNIVEELKPVKIPKMSSDEIVNLVNRINEILNDKLFKIGEIKINNNRIPFIMNNMDCLYINFYKQFDADKNVQREIKNIVLKIRKRFGGIYNNKYIVTSLLNETFNQNNINNYVLDFKQSNINELIDRYA